MAEILVILRQIKQGVGRNIYIYKANIHRSLEFKRWNRVREKGLEPSRPKTQVPKTCVSAISPLPRESR